MNNDRENETNEQSHDRASEALSFADNPTTTKPDHPNARARVYVDGLSVYSFNKDMKRAEFAFLREHHSFVKVKIYKNGCENLFWSSDNVIQSTDNATITINTTKSTKPGAEGKQYQKPQKDDEDFTYLPNIAEWYGVAKLRYLTNAAARAALSARLNVHDAVFYTLQRITSTALRRKGTGPVEDLKQIGRVIAGDIFCPASEELRIEVKLKDGTIISVPPLNHPDKYTITVRTKATHLTNHFSMIYKILEKPAAEEEFSFRFYQEEPFTHCGEGGIEVARDDGHEHDHSKKKASDVERFATEYACQAFGGGGANGGQPDIP